MNRKRIKLIDAMGLSPLSLRLRQALVTLFGEEDVPRSKFGISSLKQLYPKIGKKLWRGDFFIDKTIIISNLFNHTPTSIKDGWSVKKTQVLDFREKSLTYNSHNGTDFSIPVGSKVCAAASGEIVSIKSEFNRGGLKIFIDHGDGLMTCYAHLAKSLVNTGDIVNKGDDIAISGYSGIDGAITYPFGLPHVHFNVWLNGKPIDPFSFRENKSLWNGENLPTFTKGTSKTFAPSVFEPKKVKEALNDCKTLKVKNKILSLSTIKEQAIEIIIEMNYYPTRFSKYINVYDKDYPREACLDLPFSQSEFSQVVFLDELLSKKH